MSAEMQRRSFLQLLALVPAFSAPAQALAALDDLADAPATAEGIGFEFRGFRYPLISVQGEPRRRTVIDITSLGDGFAAFGLADSCEQDVTVELAGQHKIEAERGGFAITGPGYSIAGFAEVVGVRYRHDATLLRFTVTRGEAYVERAG